MSLIYFILRSLSTSGHASLFANALAKAESALWPPASMSDYQRAEAIKRSAAGETLASIAKSYGVHIAMISRL